MSDKDKKPPSPEDLQKDLREFFKNKFGSNVISIPVGFGSGAEDEGAPPVDEEKQKTKRKVEALRFDLTPAQVKAHLDRFVIGQEEAKRTLAVAVCDHYNHIRRVHREKGAKLEYVKQNVILLGPTGVGKTYLIRTLAQLIGVPFAKADITKFSETGYVGGDVDDLVRELVRMADGDIELAEYGIIFLDEIDKIASASNIIGRDVSGRGVQTGLLKLMEETEVSARSPNDISAQFQEFLGRGGRGRKMINTRHILFVVSGAFSGLDQIIERRLSQQSVGFAVSERSASRQPGKNILSQVSTKDFIDFGFEPEFIGRLPIRVALDDLTEDDLFRILESSEGSILKQYRENFLGYGIEAAFSEEAMRAIASRSIEEKTGARGLMTVLDGALRSFKFHLPGGPVRKLLVTDEVIRDPAGALDRLLADPAAAHRQLGVFEVRQFEKDFEQRHGIALAFDDSAVEMAIGVSQELGLKLREYLENTFQRHAEFFVKIKEKSGRTRFPVTPQILTRPGDALDLWL
jgi:endopeptidase Clp ATP-binding regulatory subunit ClpX